jgi:hypothetical protein
MRSHILAVSCWKSFRDGLDGSGKEIAGETYFAHLDMGGNVATRKLTLLR